MALDRWLVPLTAKDSLPLTPVDGDSDSSNDSTDEATRGDSELCSDTDSVSELLDGSVELPKKRLLANRTSTRSKVMCTESTSSSGGGSRKFSYGWLEKYRWLRYDQDVQVMSCDVCRKSKMKNAYSRGTNNFNYTNLLRHANSSDHKRAVLATSCELITSSATRATSKAEDALTAASKNVYWLAKEELATFKYSSLNALTKAQDCPAMKHLCVGRNAQYTSYDIAEEIQDAISSCIEEDIDHITSESPFIGILIDESTDISSSKNLIVYVRVVTSNGDFQTHFLKLLEVESQATAQNIYALIKQQLDLRKIPLSKCLGLATDGASTMTGKENGVAALMVAENPYLIPVHCIAHRLALATSQAAKSIPYLVKFQRYLVSIYSYFRHSTNRVHDLQEIERILEDPTLKYQPVYEVRWMSLHLAVQAVRRTLNSLITFLENEVASEHDPAARGILEEVRKYEFLATVHLLDDVLLLLTKLSKVFQRENIDFSIIAPMVHSTTSAIKAMKTVPGPILKSFQDEVGTVDGITPTFKGKEIKLSSTSKEQFKRMSLTFIDKVVDNLKQRFPEVDTITAMKLLDPQFLPQKQSSLATYGVCELDVLLEHYGTPKVVNGKQFNPPVDADACRQEMPLFKQLVFHSYSSMSLHELWKIMAAKHVEHFPALITLAKACFIVPVSTAQCERGFSTQNRIKSKLRNRLKAKHLDILLRIS